MKEKNKHTCRKKDKEAIIYRWKLDDGYKELVGKWTLDVFDFSGHRTVVIIKYCPYCGVLL